MASIVSVNEDHQGQFIQNVHDPVDVQDAATKNYVDNVSVTFNALIFKGVIDCSTNPNYPAADRGFLYVISVAGKIGGASGVSVLPRDIIICLDNGTASGNQATVGSHWSVVHSSVNSVIGPSSATDSDFVQWDGTTGVLIKDGGLSLDTDTGLAADSDLKIPSQKAVKSYVDMSIPSGAALTKTDDTNVTLSLGGSPTTALLQAASIAVGWTGLLAVNRGGTGVNALGDITKTNDTNVTLTLGGTPTGSVIQAVSLTLGWTGTLAVSRGGTGAATVGAHLYFGNNTGSTAAPGFHQIDYSELSGTPTIPTVVPRGVAFGSAKTGGISTGKLNGYFTVPFNGTITGWSLSVDTGTVTVKFWKKAAGTAVPTVSDNINTSGVSLSTGTHVRSTTVSDFTTTAVTAGDIIAVNITALTGTITDFSGTLEITPS
jgi:hypothetical protein